MHFAAPPLSLPPLSSAREGRPRAVVRSAGGLCTLQPRRLKRPPRLHQLSSTVVQLREAQKHEAQPCVTLSADEVQRGALSLVERRLLHADARLGAVLRGPTVTRAPRNSPRDRYVRFPVQTNASSLASLMAIRYSGDFLKGDPTLPTEVSQPASVRPTKAVASLPAADDEDVVALHSLKGRDDPRTYAELLDLYSLHEFIIRKGKTLRNTPEFISFERSFVSYWGAIEEIIVELERLLGDHGVSLAYVDGKQVASIARKDAGMITMRELLSCVTNGEDVLKCLHDTSAAYLAGPRGHHKAATKIQATWKGCVLRRLFTRLRVAIGAARVIQRHWRTFRRLLFTRRSIRDSHRVLLRSWRATQNHFLRSWAHIAKHPRTILHLPSQSYPSFQLRESPHLATVEMSHMFRAIDLCDANVSVIMVTPQKIDEEALQYFRRYLSHLGVSDVQSRWILLHPENTKRLPSHLSLTKQTLMSDRLLRLLRSLVKGKQVYIVPGVVGPDEQLLAARLNLPIYSGEMKVMQVFRCKSQHRLVFELADAASPIGAYHLRSVGELFDALAKLIVAHRDIFRWLIKMESEFGSRGHALLEVSHLRSVSSGDPSNRTVEAIVKELNTFASKRLRVLQSLHGGYDEWNNFAATFEVVGGCVQAVPSRIIGAPTANLRLDPDGTIHLDSVVENIFSSPLCANGCYFPQSSVPAVAIHDAALSIAEACRHRKIIGYFSIDFVVYERADRPSAKSSLFSGAKMWVVDLDLGRTMNATAHHFARGGACERDSSSPTKEVGDITLGGVAKSYVYSGLLMGPEIAGLHHFQFFGSCRELGLVWNTEERSGVVFQLIGLLLRGAVGIICVDSSPSRSVSVCLQTLKLLQSEIRATNNTGDSTLESHITAVESLLSQQRAKRRLLEK